ncbi:flavin-containing monooxygenase FMO GS-OX-like 5 isoform X2 [Telopea speciosissima]|uniref:flavin-containing monooxygenase FMO GS-OX-like 5 isoform X2 n=1 Tax=Telopea speciosissima TaxID=54955 RepID=UPI001CC45089|nr:flavin-containing monooxygenase FMO GS-OX-like 5 isoform X2 [Telopea speciosissima]
MLMSLLSQSRMDLTTLTLQRLSMTPMINSSSSRKVAVIGAGAAGLVAARELRREGHKVVVFERGQKVGGTWIYDPNIESDTLGLETSRAIVHTSLYDSLRTNLPREVMGFRDYPFVAKEGKDRDTRRFPGHREVLLYLDDFARDFELFELVRFETEVFHIGMVEEGKWIVRSKKRAPTDREDSLIDIDEVYDGVVVCNGHYTEPRIAEIPGIDSWPGKQMHSHNYRVPDPFRDQVVVLIGSSSSASDISRDIASVAKEVHIAARSFTDETMRKQPGYENIWFHSMIKSAHEDGTIVFQDGSSALPDVVLHCTGYKYHFPFLQTRDIVNVDDNCVGPLYKHVFPPLLAPWLSFIGLPWKEEMMEDVKNFYSKLEAAGVPKRYTHNMGDYQFEYDDWLATECGCPVSEEWRKQMYDATGRNRHAQPETYRDVWEDQHLILQANEDFVQYK